MKSFWLALFLFLNLFIPTSVTADHLHFALFSPRSAQDAFWGPLEAFMKQAGKQLNVKVSVLYLHNSKRDMLKFIDKAKAIDVDAVIFANIGQTAFPLMKNAEEQKLPFLLFNADLLGDNLQIAGEPQQNFKYWIASLMPDDHQAGYLLGKYLIAQARKGGLTDKNGTVQVIAINGPLANTAAQQRTEGLLQAIKEDGNSNLLRSLTADWRQNTAYYKATHLLRRYPNANVYWAASDLMAIGVEQALREKGLMQGKDYLTGGVDWSKEGLTAIKQGKMSSSAGGHFMDGAWALIKLYDHFNGASLERDDSSQTQSPMSLITPSDIDLLMPYLESGNWESINFRLRSKVLNKKLKNYDFSPNSVLKELRKAEKN